MHPQTTSDVVTVQLHRIQQKRFAMSKAFLTLEQVNITAIIVMALHAKGSGKTHTDTQIGSLGPVHTFSGSVQVTPFRFGPITLGPCGLQGT